MKNKQFFFILLTVITLLLASFLRLYNIEYTEFKVDQAKNIYLTLDIIKNGPVPHYVILSSVGTYSPPIFFYFLILPVLISKNPIFLSAFIAILNILAISIAFFFFKSIFNRRIALMTILLWAVNPWSIMYSRNIWHQNVLPLFIVLFFGAIFKIVNLKQRLAKQHDVKERILTDSLGYTVLAFAALGVLMQIHISTFILSFLLLVIIIWQRKKLRVLDVGSGILIFLILHIPYLIYEIQHNFHNIAKFLETSRLAAIYHLDSFIYPFKLITTRGLGSYLGQGLFWLDNLGVGQFINYILIIFSLLGLIYIIKNLILPKKDSSNTNYIVILMWLVLPIVFLFFNKSNIYDHYFILLYPVLFLIVAIVIDKLILSRWWIFRSQKFNLIKNSMLGIILAAMVIWPFIYSFNFLRLTKNECIWAVYGKPYKYQENRVRELMESGETSLPVIYAKTCDCPFCFPVQVQYIYEYLHNDIEIK